jgi:hypothetical protein
MLRITKCLAAACLVLAGIGDASPPATAATKPLVCSRFSPAPDRSAVLGDGVLNEVSGIAASRVHPPVLWVHNDSGGAPAVYAIRPTGALVGTYTVDGATNVDWEDIAIGPGPERNASYLYVGDIGDNRSARDHVTVYRVPEPTTALTSSGTLTGTETISLRYPDHPVDAESMFVDPRSGDLFLIDKEYTSAVGHVFRAPKRQLVDGAEVTLQAVASFTLAPGDTLIAPGVAKFPGTIIAGADISPDGSTVLVRTYRRVIAFTRPAGKSVAAAFARPSCSAPQIDEPQGEAVAFAAKGAGYFTISEGAGAAVHRFAVKPPFSP